MSRAEVPPGVRDLAGAPQRSPADQDERRGPDRGVPSRCYYEDTVKLPGFGHQPNRCRPLQPVGFCRDHGHPVLGRSSCGTRYCPEHFRDWLQEAVISAVARLAAYRYVQDGAEKRLLHVVASPEPDSRWWTADAFWKARSDSYEILKAAGCRGGVTVPHPYRASEWGDEFFETTVEAGDWEESKGKWSLFRNSADGWGEMDQFIEPGPHYHALAACQDFDPNGVPSGWVAKNIRSIGRFHYRDVEAYREMVKPAYYLLTHAGAEDGRQTVTYWGEVHPASFDPAEEIAAARWDQIQQYARAAVTTDPGESPLSAGSKGPADERECPREGCESEVVPIDELAEFLEDPAFRSRVDHQQLLALYGIQVWSVMGDRPPPSAAAREARLLEWLRETGRTHHDPAGEVGPFHQVGLGDFGVSLHG